MRKIALLLPLAALAACGGDGETTPPPPPAPDTTQIVDVTISDTTDVVAPSDAADDGTPPAQCATDADCAGAFENMGQCESATCGDDKVCKRGLVAKGTACEDDDPCSPTSECDFNDAGGLVCKGVGGCDNGNPCDGTETCNGSDGCAPGTPIACADGSKCNGEETCDPASGCVPGKPLACPEDGDLCNGGAACDPGQGCVQANVPDCDDGLACTKDACDAKVGCVHDLDPTAQGCCKADSDCEDGKACTTGTCDLATGACKIENLTGPCASADPCSTGGTCQAGQCVATAVENCTVLCTLSGSAGDVIDCPVGVARLTKADTNAASVSVTVGWQGGTAKLQTFVDSFCVGGACLETAIPQSSSTLQPSGHTVTVAPVDPSSWAGAVVTQATNLLDPDKAVSDAWFESDALQGDASFVSLRFKLTASVGGSPVVLHTLSAEAAGGDTLAAKLVGHTIVTSSSPCGADICFDGHVCTNDTCSGGKCAYAPTDGSCDDGNACTTGDTCDANGDCAPAAFASSGTTCVGDNACTQVGTCDGAGDCQYDPGLSVTCPASGSPCVSNACDPASGACVTSPNVGVACNDQSACTTGDACDGLGTCSGAPLPCQDAFGCTANTCDPKSGCVFSPQSDLCDDQNPCTTDACDPKSGCTHTLTTAACDDGDACTISDACSAGKCTGKPNPDCPCKTTADCAAKEDGDLCNGTLSCVAGTCQLDAKTIVDCPPDGFDCKVGWTCDGATGTCKGEPQSCDDGIACTADSCSVTEGCLHKASFDCPIGWICAISGKKGDIVDCKVGMARGSKADPILTGGDVSIHWDTDKLALLNLVDAYCFGATCIEYEVMTCENGTFECTTEKLHPSGDVVAPSPKDIGEWLDKVHLAFFNTGSNTVPLTTAYVSGGAIVGDPEILKARFELKTDIPAATPFQIDVSDVFFATSEGLKVPLSIEVIGGERIFVVKLP